MADPQMSITMSIRGIDELLKRVSDPATVAGPVTIGMRQSGAAVQREAQQRAPVDTGRLRNDIKVEVESRSPFPTWVRIGPNVFYGIFVELGTGLFGPLRRRIRPRSARALAWTSKSGQTFVRASVRGMRPRPYMQPALDAAQQRIRRIWYNVGNQITSRMAR